MIGKHRCNLEFVPSIWALAQNTPHMPKPKKTAYAPKKGRIAPKKQETSVNIKEDVGSRHYTN